MSEQIVPLDSAWVTRAFLVVDKKLTETDYRNSFWSNATLKFTDTTIGGNIPINPPPQFTKYADVPAVTANPSVRGMSRYYSEAIDDNSQVVHFRMGEPRFNTLANFYAAAYNPVTDMASKSGRMNQVFFDVGRAVGFVVSVMSFKLLMVRALGEGFRLMRGMPKSRYYYHSPTMHTYWGAVTTMLNQLSVNRGIIPRVGGNAQQYLNDDYQFDSAALETMHDALPDVFTPQGGIDVYAMANKGARLLKKRIESINNAVNNSSLGNIDSTFASVLKEQQTNPVSDPGASFQAYLAKWYATDQAQLGTVSTGDNENGSSNTAVGHDIETSEGLFSGFQKLWDFYQTEANDGGQFASFRVSQTGPISESFSNSVGESDIANKLNSMTSSAREINFGLAGGNIAEGVGAAIDSVKALAKGVLSQFGLSGIAAVAGSAFFDIPKVWESSIASMPRANYSIKLNSPYGNPISQLFNIYIPLCMLLCMALPKSTGKQSYTSPFLIEYYDKGRAQSRLGMIDSMTVTRGTSTLGFNNEGKMLAVDVSFTIVDLSSIMHMPITLGIDPVGDLIKVAGGALAGGLAGSFLGPGGTVVGAGIGGAIEASLDSGFFDDSTIYSDYLAVLAGMDVNDQIYNSRKLKLALTRKLANWRSWASVSNLASFAGELPVPGRLMSLFYPGVEF